MTPVNTGHKIVLCWQTKRLGLYLLIKKGLGKKKNCSWDLNEKRLLKPILYQLITMFLCVIAKGMASEKLN